MRTTFAREIASGLASTSRSRCTHKARPQAISRLTSNSTTRPFSSSRHFLQDNGTTASHRITQSPSSPRAPAPATALPNRPQPATTQQPPPSRSENNEQIPLQSLTEGLDDPPPVLSEDEKQVDWTRSFHGLSAAPFSDQAAAILTQDLNPDDIEIKPDGIVYLPEIKYRRILNKAFGPGGWGLAPRGETIVTGKVVTREYGLVAGGRYVFFLPSLLA